MTEKETVPYTPEQLVEQLERIANALEKIAERLENWDEWGAIRVVTVKE